MGMFDTVYAALDCPFCGREYRYTPLSYEQAEQEIKKTKQRLDDRILIEKAKGVLMKERQISEEQAFELIRKIGMDKRRPMTDIAQIILMNQ